MSSKIIISVISCIIVFGLFGFFLYKAYFLNSGQNFYYRQKSENIFSVNERGGEELPNDFIISPGLYIIENKTYNLQKEGLYRFQRKNKIINRIVYLNDPWAIISALAWLEGPWAEKMKDIKPAHVIDKIVENNLNLSCGNIASVTTAVLQQKNINSRSVMGLNLNYNWDDDQDNGHTMLEVLIDNKWILVDIDNNLVFYSDNEILNFWDFFQKISKNENYRIEQIALDINSRNPDQMKEYYQKMIQVPFIFSGKYFMFTAEGEAKEKAQSYSHRYRFLDRIDWLNRFYPSLNYK